MVKRQNLKNALMEIAVILLIAFAVALIPQTAHADDTWNVKSIKFTPAEPTVKMSQIKERDNDGIYALNLANRYKKGMNNCFFKPGDKCVVSYNDNSTKEFEFNTIKGVSYAEFKAADGEIINLEALHTDNAEELKKSGEVSVDELAAIIGTNGVTIEYGVYEESGDEIVGNYVQTHTILEIVENTTHDHTIAIRTRNQTPAQCEATGMTETAHYCQICGKYFEDMEATTELDKADLIIPVLGHDWSEWEPVSTDPTKEVRRCSRCPETEVRTASSDIHVHNPGKELHWTKPTCTARGIDYHYVCTDEGCGAMFVKDDEGNYVQVNESALRLPARGHKKGKPVQGNVKPATCSYIGGYTLTYYCDRCGAFLTTERVDIPIDPEAHVWDEGKEITAATCTEAGNMRFTCTECEAEKDEDIPAGHKWSAWKETKPTCTAAGSMDRKCSVCGKAETKKIAAKGHKWSDWKVAKAATCIAAGSQERKCSACSKIEKKSIAAKGHKWSAWKETKPTCTAAGSLDRKCLVCGKTETKKIAAKGHKWSAWKMAKAATCTAAGSQERKCSACSKIEKKSIAAKGHKWKSTYTVDKKATYAAAGAKSIHCSVCNAKKPKSVVSIPKLKVKAVTLNSVKAVKRGFTAKWTKGSGINGYEMQYALNNKFTKSKKTVIIKKPGTISKKVTKLKAKKKYYVRVRAYKTVSGKKYYSAWSKIKTVTTKR